MAKRGPGARDASNAMVGEGERKRLKRIDMITQKSQKRERERERVGERRSWRPNGSRAGARSTMLGEESWDDGSEEADWGEVRR